MTTLKYSMVVLLSLLFSGTLAEGYTLMENGGTMCNSGNNGRWKYVYDMEDLSVCVNAVLSDPTCSNEYFGHSLTDGNCWCVPVGTDCTTESTNQNGRNTYRINYRYELLGSGGTMCNSGNNGRWKYVYDMEDPAVCMGTVLADPTCSNEYFGHSLTDGNCWCVPVNTDCTNSENIGNHWQNRRNTYSITQHVPTPEPTEATPEPTEATPEPTDATQEPTDATQEPTDATQEPTVSTMEPTVSTLEPTVSTMEPTASTLEPTEATQEPTDATMEPTDATMEPTVSTMEPTNATPEPTDATQEPTDATMEPTVAEEDSSSEESSMEPEPECPYGTEPMIRDERVWCRCEYPNFGFCGSSCGCAQGSDTHCGKCGEAKLRDGLQNACKSGLVSYDCGDDGCACGKWLITEGYPKSVGGGRLLRL
jgi:hypothetical protein